LTRKDSVENITVNEKRSLAKIGHKLPKLSGLKICKINSHIRLTGQIASRIDQGTKKSTGNLAQGTNADLLNPDKVDFEQTHVPKNEQVSPIKTQKKARNGKARFSKEKTQNQKILKVIRRRKFTEDKVLERSVGFPNSMLPSDNTTSNQNH